MAIGGAALVALLLTACTAPVPDESPTPADVTTPTPDAGGSTADPAEVAAIQAAVETTMEESNVRAAIVRVMRGDEVVLTQAWGESMAQVPATTDMHFRSGAVSIPMVSTVLLQLVDEGTVALDDKLSEWMPDVPNADKVTLEQLSQMTSGYADYVQDPTFLEDFNREPVPAVDAGGALYVRHQPAAAVRAGHQLGLRAHELRAARARTGEDHRAVDDRPDPGAHLRSSRLWSRPPTPALPRSSRPCCTRSTASVASTCRSPRDCRTSRTRRTGTRRGRSDPGSIQNTDITDMATTIQAIGRGDMVSAESFEKMIAPTLRGKTTKLDACPNTCFVQNEFYTYGLGIVLSGDWLLQNPQYHGFAGVAAYLPSEDITIAIAATYADDAFDASTGAPDNANIANPLFTAVATSVAPDASTPRHLTAGQIRDVSCPLGTITVRPPSTMRQRRRIAAPNSSPSSCTCCAGDVATSSPMPRA